MRYDSSEERRSSVTPPSPPRTKKKERSPQNERGGHGTQQRSVADGREKDRQHAGHGVLPRQERPGDRRHGLHRAAPDREVAQVSRTSIPTVQHRNRPQIMA